MNSPASQFPPALEQVIDRVLVNKSPFKMFHFCDHGRYFDYWNGGHRSERFQYVGTMLDRCDYDAVEVLSFFRSCSEMTSIG